MRLRLLAAGFVLGALGVTPPAAATPSAASRIPALRGTTVAVADTAAFTTVRLPKPIDIRDGWSLTPHGRGRLRAFVLTQVGETFSETPTYGVVYPGYCGSPGCGDPDWQGGGYGFLTGTDGSWILPAGTYRMYVVADAARLEMRMEIEGYTGRTRIRVTEPAAADFDSFEVRPLSTPDGTVYVAGGFSDLGGGDRGFAAFQFWGDAGSEVPAPYVFDDCIYYGEDHPPPDQAFAPGCEDASQGTMPNLLLGTPAPGWIAGITTAEPVPHGIGGHSLNPLSANAGGAGLWLPLTEALP